MRPQKFEFSTPPRKFFCWVNIDRTITQSLKIDLFALFFQWSFSCQLASSLGSPFICTPLQHTESAFISPKGLDSQPITLRPRKGGRSFVPAPGSETCSCSTSKSQTQHLNHLAMLPQCLALRKHCDNMDSCIPNRKPQGHNFFNFFNSCIIPYFSHRKFGLLSLRKASCDSYATQPKVHAGCLMFP